MDQRALLPSKTLVDDRRDFTASSQIRLKPDESGFQVAGPGMLDSVLVRSQTEDFSIRAETESALLIDDSWTVLNRISPDLNHIEAYEDNGRYVVKLEEYPYSDYCSVAITPQEEMRIDRLRGVWILGETVSAT